MRVRTLIASALLVGLVGFLGFRVVDLEQRVAALTQQLGSAPAAHDQAADTREPKPVSAMGSGFEARLAALERRVDELKNSQQTREKAGPIGADPQSEQQVLNVFEREASRIRDVQLEFHRNRWLEQRNGALVIFAKTYGLTPNQTSELQKVIENEVDVMVEQLRQPTMLEDPDQAVSDWQAMLDDTDAKAHKLLNRDQLAAWDTGRAFERQVLWPWLPNRMNKQQP
jgi:hypothetical protein